MKELLVRLNSKHTLEKKFTTAWLKELKDKGFYTDKISDWSVWTKKVDCYIKTDMDTYCCEIKVIWTNIFPVNRLRPNQYTALRKWHDLWWSAIVVVYSKKFYQYKIIPFSKILEVWRNDAIKLLF